MAVSYTSFESTLEPDLITAYEIPGDPVHRHNSYGRFNALLGEAAADLLSGTGSAQYQVFGGVPSKSLRSVDHGRRSSELPGMRILYDSGAELLIVKFMVGVSFELASSPFVEMFKDKVVFGELPHDSFRDIGAARFGVPGGRSKEANKALRLTTRNGEIDWPTLAIEVEVSVSFSRLRTDAYFWLAHIGGQTRVVILIAINRGTRVVKIERWEEMPSTRPRRAQGP